MTDHERLRERIDWAKSELARLKGNVEGLKSRLSDEFSITSLKEAKEYLEVCKVRPTVLLSEYEVALKAFQKEWSDG